MAPFDTAMVVFGINNFIMATEFSIAISTILQPSLRAGVIALPLQLGDPIVVIPRRLALF